MFNKTNTNEVVHVLSAKQGCVESSFSFAQSHPFNNNNKNKCEHFVWHLNPFILLDCRYTPLLYQFNCIFYLSSTIHLAKNMLTVEQGMQFIWNPQVMSLLFLTDWLTDHLLSVYCCGKNELEFNKIESQCSQVVGIILGN